MAFDLSWKRIRAVKPDGLALLRLAALTAWALAALAVGRAALRSRETPARVRARANELVALSAMGEQVSGWEAAERAVVREVNERRPFDLAGQAALLAGAGETNVVREVFRGPVAGGWETARVQVRVDSLSLAALSPLLEGADAADPPWRLRSIVVEPQSPRPGKGRVSLEFETLTRKSASGTVP